MAGEADDRAGLLRAPTLGWIRARLPWWVATAIGFTALFVELALRFGHLQSDLQGDDMMSLLDGLDRLEEFRRGGLAEMISGYLQHPPHTPWSSFLAATCFALFGPEQWAPFLGNALLILVLIGFVDYLASGQDPWPRRFCLAMACTVPFAAQGVMQFRPDFAAGLFTAIGVTILLLDDFAEPSRAARAVAGLACGLALFAKPSASPFTVVVAIGTLGLAELCGLLARGALPSKGRVAADWGWFLGPMLAVAAPYYAVGWREVLEIVLINTVSAQAEDWKMSGGVPFHWAYYLTGVGGRMMLRYHLYLFAGIGLASAGLAARSRNRVAILRHAAFAVVLAVTWGIPTRLGSFNPFFTQTFDVLLLFGAVLGVGEVAPRVAWRAAPIQWSVRVAAAGGILLAIVGLASRPSGVTPDPARIRLQRQIYRDVLHHVRPAAGAEPVRVFLTCNGDIEPETLTWLARREGWSASFRAPEMSTDLEAFRREMDGATFVLAVTTHGQGKVHPWMRCADVAEAALGMVQSRGEFREVAVFGPLGANEYHLFARSQ